MYIKNDTLQKLIDHRKRSVEHHNLDMRNDSVIICRELLVLARIEALVAAVGVDQPLFVEAVAAHHAANGVRKEPFDVFFAIRAIERDLVVGDFWA